jgi:hypothetical protein
MSPRDDYEQRQQRAMEYFRKIRSLSDDALVAEYKRCNLSGARSELSDADGGYPRQEIDCIEREAASRWLADHRAHAGWAEAMRAAHAAAPGGETDAPPSPPTEEP